MKKSQSKILGWLLVSPALLFIIGGIGYLFVMMAITLPWLLVGFVVCIAAIMGLIFLEDAGIIKDSTPF